MADVKTLQTRIALKYDTYASWNDATAEGKGANLVLLPGEIGFCEIPSGNANATNAPAVLFKVGNGQKKFSELNWASALAADVYSWAKASDVRLTGKTIEFVGGKDENGNDIIIKSIPLNYVTEAEVKAITDPLSGKIAVLEAKFGDADGSVDSKLANHETRIKANEDKLTGVESTVVAAIESSASATKTAYEAADAQVLVDAKAYTDTEAKKASDAAAEVAADLSAHESASNPHNITAATVGLDKVENKTVAEIKSDITGSVAAADTGFVTGAAVYTAVEAAKSAANTYADGLNTAMDTRVADLETFETAQGTKNGELAQAIADEKSARETAVSDEATARSNADAAIEAKIGTVAEGKTVVGLISDAQSAADNAQDAVDALAAGAVADNAAAIAQLTQDLAAEAEARSTKDENLEGRLVLVEAFFDPKDAEGNSVEIDKALDTLVEIQKYITEDGSAAGEMVEDIEANAKAIENLSKEFIDGGRVTAAEAAIDAVEAEVDALQTLTAGFEDGVTVKAAIEAAESAAKAEAATKAAAAQAAAEATAAADATSKANAAQAAAEQTAATALSEAVKTLNAKDAELVAEDQRLAGVIDTKLTATEFTGWKATHETDHAGTASEITAEIGAATKVINDKIGTVAEGKTVVGLIEAAQSTANTAASDLSALTTRVTTAEGDIDALEAIVKTGADANATLRTDLTTLANAVNNETTGLAATKKVVDDAAAAIDALEKGQVATNKSDIATIKGDYLKMADLFIIDCGSATTVTHTAPTAAE